MTANEKRAAVVAKYKTILGRNKYSQAKRGYAYKKHSDGKYYSDCSSSIALTYKEAGFPFYDNNGSYNPNTVGMYQAKSLKDVPVIIKGGIIQNPEVLRPGDMLLFAGSDNSRKYADCVGHVEMVAEISGSKVTLYGHGSGTPRATDMNTYCRNRYNLKTSTVIGNKGLLKVRRFIWDEAATETTEDGKKHVVITGGTVNIRSGPGKQYSVLDTAKKGEKYPAVDMEGWHPIDMGSMVGWVSDTYADAEGE